MVLSGANRLIVLGTLPIVGVSGAIDATLTRGGFKRPCDAGDSSKNFERESVGMPATAARNIVTAAEAARGIQRDHGWLCNIHPAERIRVGPTLLFVAEVDTDFVGR